MLGYSWCGIGLICVFIFIFTIDEPKLTAGFKFYSKKESKITRL